jgi:hypothetical protein
MQPFFANPFVSDKQYYYAFVLVNILTESRVVLIMQRWNDQNLDLSLRCLKIVL